MGHLALDLYLPQDIPKYSSQCLQYLSIADFIALAFASLVAAAFFLRERLWDRPDPYYHIYFERPQQENNIGKSHPQTRNIAQKLAEDDKTVVIFWGSQSGTGERFSNQLAKECYQRFGLRTLAADLSDYDPSSIAELSNSHFAIFILSTYGEGDPSDNAGGFWDWINSDIGVSLSNLRYAAFGLGNSNYKYYNRVVDVVVSALNRLEARLCLPLGRADDAIHSTEEDFLSWKDNLFDVFRKDFQLEEKTVEYQPTMICTEDESMAPIDLHHGEPAHTKGNPKAATACSPIRALSVKHPRELFNSVERNCVHLELDLSEHPEVLYKTGDHIAVWPSNPQGEVDMLLSGLGLLGRQDIPVSLKSVDPLVKVQIPTPTTTRALFTHYLEICAPLSRSTIQGLAPFAPSDEAKSLIIQLGNDKAFFSNYVNHTHLTFGRLLSLASSAQPWSKLPLSYVIESLSPLQPRYYSISSSSVLSPRKATITALVAAEPLLRNVNHKINGVASNYLLALSRSQEETHKLEKSLPSTSNIQYDLSGPFDVLHGTKLFAHVRKSKFKLPIQSSCPIIMVAAGTGLAPFRAFISERAKLHAVGKQIGDMILFFGCRKPEEDYIYREELEQIQSSLPEGKLNIITAFSRAEGQVNKVYVQHRVREHGRTLIPLIEEKSASFYICGRASMAREVGLSLSETVKSINGWSDTQVKSWSEALRRRGKWREDVWG